MHLRRFTNELAFGTHDLPGIDRVYERTPNYPLATTATLAADPSKSVSMVLATCSEPPGPQARCMATLAIPGESRGLRMTDRTDTPSGTPHWIVADTPLECGACTITFQGPVG